MGILAAQYKKARICWWTLFSYFLFCKIEIDYSTQSYLKIPHRIVGEKRYDVVVNEAMKHHGEIFPIAILKKTMLRNLHVMMLTNLLAWTPCIGFSTKKFANHLKFVL